MHELAVTRSIVGEIRRAAEREGIRPTRARVEVGELTTFKPDPIRYYARILVQDDPLLDGLELDIDEVPGSIRCLDCGSEGLPASELTLACAGCGSFNVSIVSGNDVIVRSIRGNEHV